MFDNISFISIFRCINMTLTKNNKQCHDILKTQAHERSIQCWVGITHTIKTDLYPGSNVQHQQLVSLKHFQFGSTVLPDNRVTVHGPLCEYINNQVSYSSSYQTQTTLAMIWPMEDEITHKHSSFYTYHRKKAHARLLQFSIHCWWHHGISSLSVYFHTVPLKTFVHIIAWMLS